MEEKEHRLSSSSDRKEIETDPVHGLEMVQDSWFASNGWLFGLIMALLVAVVIIGGIRSIARVTDKIVPLMFQHGVVLGPLPNPLKQTF